MSTLLFSPASNFHLPQQRSRHEIAESVLQLQQKLGRDAFPADANERDASSSSSAEARGKQSGKDILMRDSLSSRNANPFLKADTLDFSAATADISAFLAGDTLGLTAASSSASVGGDLNSILDESWLNGDAAMAGEESSRNPAEKSFLSGPNTPPPALPLASPTRIASEHPTIDPADIFAPVDASPVLNFPEPMYPSYDYFSYDGGEFDPTAMSGPADGDGFANMGMAMQIQQELQTLQKQGLLYDFGHNDKELVEDPFKSLREGGVGKGYEDQLIEAPIAAPVDLDMDDGPDMVKFEDDDVDPLTLIHQPSPNNPGRHAGNQPREPTEVLERELMKSNLSTRERRQLRNKISARNFRLRKKEYVNTLEDQLRGSEADRRALRASLTKVLEENKKLKAEVAVYRKAMGGDIISAAVDPTSSKKAEALGLPALPTNVTANPALMADPSLYAALGYPPMDPTVVFDPFTCPPFSGAYAMPDSATPDFLPQQPAYPPVDFKTYLEMLTPAKPAVGPVAKPPVSTAAADATKAVASLLASVNKDAMVPMQAKAAAALQAPVPQPEPVSKAPSQPQSAPQFRPRNSSLPADQAAARPTPSLVFTAPAGLVDTYGASVAAQNAAPAPAPAPAPQPSQPAGGSTLSQSEYDAIKRNIAAALRENARARQAQLNAQAASSSSSSVAPQPVQQPQPQTQGQPQAQQGQSAGPVQMQQKAAALQKEASQAAAQFIQSLLKGTAGAAAYGGVRRQGSDAMQTDSR